MKYIITGIEKVRDVIEAEDQESAENLFRARYPALIQITDIKNDSKKTLSVKQEFWQGLKSRKKNMSDIKNWDMDGHW